MLAIHAPSVITLITPARRDSPRPTATVRSASAPRPKTSRLPSGILTASPDGVLTCAVSDVLGWMDIVGFLSAGPAGSAAPVLGSTPCRMESRPAHYARPIPESGDG